MGSFLHTSANARGRLFGKRPAAMVAFGAGSSSLVLGCLAGWGLPRMGHLFFAGRSEWDETAGLDVESGLSRLVMARSCRSA